jgi:outer membrane protein assembly factor BamB
MSSGTREKRNASESCPVLVNGLLFQVTRGGVVSCTRPLTGEDVWEERFTGQHLPSPVAAGDRIYFSNDRGDTRVIRAAATCMSCWPAIKLPDAMIRQPWPWRMGRCSSAPRRRWLKIAAQRRS